MNETSTKQTLDVQEMREAVETVTGNFRGIVNQRADDEGVPQISTDAPPLAILEFASDLLKLKNSREASEKASSIHGAAAASARMRSHEGPSALLTGVADTVASVVVSAAKQAKDTEATVARLEGSGGVGGGELTYLPAPGGQPSSLAPGGAAPSDTERSNIVAKAVRDWTASGAIKGKNPLAYVSGDLVDAGHLPLTGSEENDVLERVHMRR